MDARCRRHSQRRCAPSAETNPGQPSRLEPHVVVGVVCPSSTTSAPSRDCAHRAVALTGKTYGVKVSCDIDTCYSGFRQFFNNFMLPKRRFWKEEQKMQSGFSIACSMVRSPNRVLTSRRQLVPFFRQRIQVDTCVEMFEMEIVEKRGLVADGGYSRP